MVAGHIQEHLAGGAVKRVLTRMSLVADIAAGLDKCAAYWDPALGDFFEPRLD